MSFTLKWNLFKWEIKRENCLLIIFDCDERILILIDLICRWEKKKNAKDERHRTFQEKKHFSSYQSIPNNVITRTDQTTTTLHHGTGKRCAQIITIFFCTVLVLLHRHFRPVNHTYSIEFFSSLVHYFSLCVSSYMLHSTWCYFSTIVIRLRIGEEKKLNETRSIL